MKPAPFDHHAPEQRDDAVALLATYGDDARVIAGGQSLVPLMALRLARPAHLVDVGRVADLRGVRRDDGHLAIGATTRQAEIEHDPDVGAEAALLSRATPLIGHFQIRNRGTIGGSLAHADPAAEYPAVALALGAEIELARRDGTRTVPAAEFFTGHWTTSAAPDELLVALRIPIRTGRRGHAIHEVARRAGDFALAGAATTIALDDEDRITDAAIALFGVDATPRRAAAAEAGLVGVLAADVDVEAASQTAVSDLDPPSDVHGSAEYRRRVGAHVVERALVAAMEEARGQ